MLFFQKLKYEFIEFLYLLHIRMYKSFDQDIIFEVFLLNENKMVICVFCQLRWVKFQFKLFLLINNSVDISLLLGWFHLVLLFFGRFFPCFFLYLFFFWPHHYLTQMSITASKIWWRSSSLLQHFLSPSVCSWIIFMIISLLTLLIIFYQYDKRFLSHWELRSCHAVNNERGQRVLRNRP